MYSARDQFLVTIINPDLDKNILISKTNEWIKTKRIFGTIHKIHEDENQIQIKHPVYLISSGLSVRWTPNARAAFPHKY
jgi:hypothetical protein